MRRLLALSCLLALSACATLSPASRIESRLIDMGLSRQRAACLAGELKDNLDRKDLADVADFLDDISRAGSTGNVVDRLLRIDNPRAAATLGAAAISCALSR